MSSDTAIGSLEKRIDELNYKAWNMRVQDSPKTFSLCKEALALARSVNYTKGIAEGTRTLGFCYGRLSKNEEAIAVLKESLSLFESLNDLDGQSNVLEYLGFIHRNLGELGTALKLLFKALSLAEQTGFPENLATGHYQLGVTYKHLGDYEKALDHLYQSITINREMKNALYEAYSINVIGSIYFDNGNYEMALDQYKQSLVARNQSGDKWGEAGSLDNIGFTYLKLNEYDEAINYCKQSLAISSGTNDKRGQANALIHLAEIYKQKKDVEQAAKFSQESLEIRKASADKRGEAEILLFLADLHKTQTGDHQKVLEWLISALKIAEEIKALDLQSKATFHLYEYYKEGGNFEEALKNLDLHTQLEKELHKNAIIQKVSNLEISHRAETISRRNKELTELNEQIEKANAELKIEASLERVRAVAMGMKEPADMLEVCRIISEQMELMNVKDIRNVQTAIVNQEKGIYLNYEYFTQYKRTDILEIETRLHPAVEEFAAEMVKSKDAIFFKSFEGEALDDWREYRTRTNQDPDPILEKASSLHYYFYSIGSGALGISVYSKLSEDELELFKRFRNVFELAYQRFVDIQKALAQAREAQIQLALERVRARTMAMHNSDEITETVKLIYQEFDKLKISNESTDIEIGIIDEQTGIANVWAHFYLSDGTISKFKFPLKHFPLMRDEFRQWKDTATEKRKELFFTSEISGKLWDEFIKCADELPELEEIFRPLKEAKIDKWVTHNAYFSHGILTLQGTDHYSAETLEIQKRFAKVFEQTYTRFLDLQKAEAQAREAQIETAVEKVRSRSLAMHKSDELQEVVHTVFERLKELNVDFYTAIIVLFNNDSRDIIWWLESKANQRYQRVLVPYTPIPYLNDLFEIRKNGGDLLSKCYAFDEKNQLFNHLFGNTDFKWVPEQQKQFLLGAEFATISVALAKNTGIHVTSYSKKSFSDHDNLIFKRFAKVFEQAYTRFLDLQKAEAQTREAQIQLSLERIRAKAMAMYHSDELSDVLPVLFEQFRILDINPVFAHLSVFDLEKNLTTLRITGKGGARNMAEKTVPIDAMKEWKAELQNWKESKPSSISRIYYPKEIVPEIWNLFGDLFDQLPDDSKIYPEDFPHGIYCIQGNTGFGYMGLNHTREATEEEKDIINRFAIEFGRMYQRFLDLQKAEAQAREAQIEAALERVRAKVMAMRNSSDLNETSLVFGEQLKKLGIDWQFSYFWLIEEGNDENSFWITWPDNKTSTTKYSWAEADESFRECLVAWQQQVKIHATYVPVDDVAGWLATFERITSDAGGMAVDIMTPGNFKEGVYYYDAMIRFGSFGILTNRKTSEEEQTIQCRFAVEFERAYTRFLDLQKAEVQAREAQIQLALERVRARTMAMQKSDELPETSYLLFQQVKELGLTAAQNSIAIINEEAGFVELSTTVLGHHLPRTLNVPINDPYVMAKAVAAWKAKRKSLKVEIEGQELKDYNEHRNSFFETKVNFPEDRWVVNIIFFSKGWLSFSSNKDISDETFELLKRLAAVFEQTYIRFSDLKQAEGQAREAEIQLALERVRARTMAMQKSEELLEVITIFSEQLAKLEISFDNVSFGVNDQADDFKFWLSSVGQSHPIEIKVPYLSNPAPNRVIEAQKKGLKFFADSLTQDENNRWIQHLMDHSAIKLLPDKVKNYLLTSPGYARSTFILKDINLYIGNYKNIAYHEEENNIFKRFALAFEQSYTRFLDLQKAEARTREAQIEVAVERVRAKALAMHKSEDLHNVVVTLKKELTGLQIPNITAATIYLSQKDGSIRILDLSDTGEEGDDKPQMKLDKIFRLEDTDPDLWIRRMWIRNDNYFVLEADEDDFVRAVQWIKTVDPAGAEMAEKIIREKSIKKAWLPTVKLENGVMNIDLLAPPAPEIESILLKMGAGFDLAYKRFLDLQKAEAQAREAQIELGLERVRARTMAMQKSEEVTGVAVSLNEELLKLGFEGGSTIIIINEKTGDTEQWTGFSEDKTLRSCYVPHFKHPYHDALLKAWKRNEKFLVYTVSGADKKTLDEHYFATGYKIFPENDKMWMREMEFVTFSHAFMKYGAIHWGPNHLTEEQLRILLRFSKVFEQSYTRFLDLQKAEAQAREAQIETAMERIRARAMAMHTSGELMEVANVLREQMGLLNQPDLETSAVLIYHDDLESWDSWYAFRPTRDKKGNILNGTATFSKDDCALTGEIVQHFRSPATDYTLEVSGAKRDEWLGVLMKAAPDIAENAISDETVKYDTTYFHFSDFKGGSLLTVSYLPPSAEIRSLQRRAASVFDLAFRRFRDLQKAEAQSREAKIETALEKVRASTMAMQKSEDLSKTAFVLFNQFKELGAAPERIFIATFDDQDKGIVDIWGTDQGGNQLNKLFKVPVNEPTMVSKIIAAWKEKKRSVVVDLQGEELKTYLGFLKLAGIPVIEGIMSERRVQTAACFSNGVIGVTTSEPQSAEAVQLQERFASVFDLAYTRFLDLQKAEAQAHEARIETALERVRARALAMQEPEELKEVAQVLRSEMGLLGVEELETCSIYIHEKDSETAECWYALRDPKENEKKMVTDHFHLELNETWVGRQMKKFYSSDEKQASIVMQGENRKEWIAYCYKHSPVFSGFYGETIPDRTYHLYKFSHGYIGAAAPGEISAESWRLLHRAASVFSLAYSRFKDLTQARNDLIRLKEEKKRAEDALTELQATQRQLIQSEKMASLGELTAGIAHEIQNPLNFVNNFSDVSNELIGELKIKNEKLKIEDEEVKELLNDISQNLEKINHHGKRADAIVKGMLQHSRSSSGQKEPTDINSLAEEYLRLAYHGLRAKDKFFNAKFETDLDPSINKINVVPQEIGRVILNLINNSFYAVSEKKKTTPPPEDGIRTLLYEPTVKVKTAKNPASGGRGPEVVISVIDNGNGIPQKVLEKIFQPFFTTKPTGEGTGLGLSLAYDIITNGHGGEIKVDTREGEGSEFTITLPMN